MEKDSFCAKETFDEIFNKNYLNHFIATIKNNPETQNDKDLVVEKLFNHIDHNLK